MCKKKIKRSVPEALKEKAVAFCRANYESTPKREMPEIEISFRLGKGDSDGTEKGSDTPKTQQNAARLFAVEDFVRAQQEQSFAYQLFRVIDKKGLSDTEVYKKAHIDRRLFSKLKRDKYSPSKKTVFSLMLALELSTEEGKELLQKAGFCFNRSCIDDLIVLYCIENGIYDIFTVNALLDALGYKPLYY